mmetsp:Transcript_32733/g.52227  ORF Transcript_32733/g.52227 Transcript_32733/m.52227 type:complete len:83 (+) Transcript_32733:171-419(+)
MRTRRHMITTLQLLPSGITSKLLHGYQVDILIPAVFLAQASMQGESMQGELPQLGILKDIPTEDLTIPTVLLALHFQLSIRS